MFLKKVLIKYWATYVSITLFTILLMFPIYLQTYDNVKDRQISDLRTLLQSRFDALVAEYNDMTRIVADLKTDRNFVLISNWADQPERINLYHYIQFQKSLAKSVLPNALILDAFVQFQRSDYVVSKRLQAVARADFYKNEFRYLGMDFDQFEDMLWNRRVPLLPAAPVRFFQTLHARALTFLFYPGRTDAPCAVIGLVVNEKSLLDRLLTGELRKYGTLRLSGAGGETWTAFSAMDAGPFNTFLFEDDMTGIALEVSVHERAFMDSTRAVRNMILTYVGIAMLASVFLSLAYTVNVYRPVRSYYAQLLAEGLAPPNEKNFHQLLNVSLTGLLTRKRDLERALEDINARHRAHLITNIFHRLPVTAREMDAYVAGLPVLQADYAVIRFQLRPTQSDEGVGLSLSDVSQVYDALHGTLRQAFGKDHFLLPAQRSALIALDDGGLDALCGTLAGIVEHLRTEHACAPVFAVSSPCQGADALHGGYAEATQVLRFSSMFDQPVMRMDQLGALSSRYDIVLFQPEILLGQLMLTDTRSLEAHMDALLEQLAHLHFARPRRAAQLYYNIVDTCAAALHKHGLPALPDEEYDANQEISVTMDALRRTMLEVNRSIRSSRAETPARRDTVLDYVKANFRNPNLSLTEIAQAFFYSEGYIYQIVKKQTGLSYIDYLNALRMECATGLICDTDLSSAEIAEQSGYATLNTFYKAFKKKYGVSPKLFREQHRKTAASS